MTDVVITAFPTNQDLDPAQLRQAFGIFPSGVVAVAAEVDGQLVGLAASSFTSVSLDPPLVSFSIANTSKTWPTCAAPRTWVSPSWPTTTAWSHGSSPGRWPTGSTGWTSYSSDRGAVTLRDGLALFDTTIHNELKAGDHTIVLLRLHAVQQVDHALPLVFHRSGFKRLSADDLDPAKLDGRINGKDVDAA